MRRVLLIIGAAVLCAAPLAADVRVTSITNMEGAFSALVGGLAPRMVMYIKGSKARTDVEVGDQTLSSITDLEAKQITVLNGATKTAQVIPFATVPAAPGGTPMAMPKIDASFKPTGRTQVIAGTTCDEVAVRLAVSMAGMGGPVPPEAGDIAKNLRVVLDGTMWVGKSGPGVAEYLAFSSSATKHGAAAMMNAFPAGSSGGLDRLMDAFAGAGGLPYLTELGLTIEGNDQISALLKSQGPIKLTSKVTDVSTEPLADDLFRVPADYQIVKPERRP